MSRLKCCAYSSIGYQDITDHLDMYIADFKVETEVRPFMLPYRQYDLYIFQTDGLDFAAQETLFERLPTTIRCYQTRVFAAWSQETLEHLKWHHPRSVNYQNFIDLDSPDWVEKLLKALTSSGRVKNERKG